MRDVRERAKFLLQPINRGCREIGKSLDRDAFTALTVLCLEDLAHPARADASQYVKAGRVLGRVSRQEHAAREVGCEERRDLIGGASHGPTNCEGGTMIPPVR